MARSLCSPVAPNREHLVCRTRRCRQRRLSGAGGIQWPMRRGFPLALVSKDTVDRRTPPCLNPLATGNSFVRQKLLWSRVTLCSSNFGFWYGKPPHRPFFVLGCDPNETAKPKGNPRETRGRRFGALDSGQLKAGKRHNIRRTIDTAPQTVQPKKGAPQNETV